MFSNSSMLHQRQPQLPVFNGYSYEIWRIKMKTFFESEGLWELIQPNYVEENDDEVRQKEYRKQDAKALFFIQQAVDDSIFPRIATAISAKQAWSFLERDYQKSDKMSRLDWYQFQAANIDVGLLLPQGSNVERTKLSSPSISMVSSAIRDRSPSCYTPQTFSIGPLHRKNEYLQRNEEKKAIYAYELLASVKETTPEETFQACAGKVYASIDKIRSCYAEVLIYSNSELSKMMVMDGCFILKLLYDGYKAMKFYMNSFYDLLLIENQIPFFVLEDIFECTISNFDPEASLIGFIHAVMEFANPFKGYSIRSYSLNHHHHHIIGLLHKCYEFQFPVTQTVQNSDDLNILPSAVGLDRAGVKIKPAIPFRVEWPLKINLVKSSSFSWSWGKPTLVLPALKIHDFTELVFRNLMAYEQLCGLEYQFIASYAYFMDMLIDSGEDIAVLIESRVISNTMGSNEEAAGMINNLCKNVKNWDFFYYTECRELARHCNRRWPKNMAWLKRTYFNNPWNIIALLAGIALFVLTVVQTIFTVKGSK